MFYFSAHQWDFFSSNPIEEWVVHSSSKDSFAYCSLIEFSVSTERLFNSHFPIMFVCCLYQHFKGLWILYTIVYLRIVSYSLKLLLFLTSIILFYEKTHCDLMQYNVCSLWQCFRKALVIVTWEKRLTTSIYMFINQLWFQTLPVPWHSGIERTWQFVWFFL